MRRRRREEEQEQQRPAPTEASVPIDQVNEQVLLAAAVVDVADRKDLVDRLPEDAFLVDVHRAIWAGMRELVHRGLDYDAATLQRIVGREDVVSYLGKLVEVREGAPRGNLKFHVDAVLWDRQRALAITGPIAALVEAVRDPKAAPERVRALARHVSDSFASGHGHSWLVTPEQLGAASSAELDRVARGEGVFPYGIEALDHDEQGKPLMVPGAKPGKLTVISGMSGGGKTTIAAHLLLGLARGRRTPLYCAFEVTPKDMLHLMTAISLAESEADLPAEEQEGWSRAAVFSGIDAAGGSFFTPARRKAFDERRDAIAKRVRFMSNPFRRRAGAKVNNDSNLDLLQQHVQDSGADVFVVDLWLRTLRYKDDDAVEEALWRQQAMAEEMGAHAILLHQQRLKDIEQRPDKRPTREGIKGTSAWVDVADAILAPHIPSLFKRVPDDTFELLCLKQRDGRWPFALAFDYCPRRGMSWRGREVPYDPPGEAGGIDDFVAPARPRRKR